MVERLRKRRRRLTKQYRSKTVASKFMSIVNDDLLLQIFLRLPNSRCVIQCGCVCKRWFSLISLSENFIRSFNHHHRHKRLVLGPNSRYHSLPFTLLIRGPYLSYGGCLQNLSYFKRQPCHDFFSKKSKILHHGHNNFVITTSTSVFSDQSSYLDFMGWNEWKQDYALIWSSFDDLLLVNQTRIHFYICNPLTRQFVGLPRAPTYHKAAKTIHRAGFVCEPNCDCCNNKQLGRGLYNYYCNCSIKYKVVVITMDFFDLEFHAAIFSSETGKWSELTFRFSVDLFVWHPMPVGSNGIIYWPFGKDEFQGIVAFDPSSNGIDISERCCVINLPRKFDRERRRNKCEKARLGVVQGRLRLSQFFWYKKIGSFILKTWDLVDAKTSTWVLLHHVPLARSNPSMSLYLIALHPDDEDVFFFSRNKHCETDEDFDICQYRIGTNKLETLCQLPKLKTMKDSPCVFTLVHPWWPTTIPKLPSI